ncbi:MAG: hypothetical protein HC880_00375 [Bacteroidia bacterium]|nr:hypothetical protein [Bacteroidia bacterium]
MNLESRKKQLIADLIQIDNEWIIALIESLLQEVKQKQSFYFLARPIRKTTNMAEIAREQGYNPNTQKLIGLGGVWQEESATIEELINQI